MTNREINDARRTPPREQVARGPAPILIAAGVMLALVVMAGAVIATLAAITSYDFSDRDDGLLLLKYLAILTTVVVFAGLWISGLVAYPKRVVPVSTWLALMALLWSLAAFDDSSLWWKAACLLGPSALTLLLLGAEVSRHRKEGED